MWIEQDSFLLNKIFVSLFQFGHDGLCRIVSDVEKFLATREVFKCVNRQRITIEGKFGQGKNGYNLNYIRAKTARTSEAWINSIFMVMNLMVLLKVFIWLCTCSYKYCLLKSRYRLKIFQSLREKFKLYPQYLLIF